MKISIRFKIVTLGAFVSILTASLGIIFANVNYRSNGRESVLNTIDTWLTSLQKDISNIENNDSIYDAMVDTKEYIEPIYAKLPEKEPEFKTFKEKRDYYHNIYLWLYPFDGISMRYITPEEAAFRDVYSDAVYSINEIKVGTGSLSVYVAYYDQEKSRLVYLMDNLATKKNNDDEYHLPGTYLENYDPTLTPSGAFYEKVFPNEVTKVAPIYSPGAGTGDPFAYIYVSYTFDAVDTQADTLLRTQIITLSLSTVGLIIFFAIASHFLITRNLKKLATSTSEFDKSLLNGEVLKVQDPHIKTNDEVKDLSNSFISLENSVINYSSALEKETKEKEKINAELSIASKIQLESLEPYNYNDNHIGVNAYIKTAKEVGGDFYDYFYIDENRFGFVIADVSGKGIPASLFMMRAKAVIKNQMTTSTSLKQAAYDINNILIDNNKEGLFVTAFIGIIDLKKHVLHFLDAGHERPYLINKDGVKQLEMNTNFVFGGVKDFNYIEGEMPYKEDDRLFLFTDGLNESINKDREEFGYDRIKESLTKNKDLNNYNIITKMDEDLLDFTKGEEAFDDITLLMVELKDPRNNLSLKYHNPGFEAIEEITNEFNKKFSSINPDFRSEVGIIIDEMINNYISYERKKNLVISTNFALRNDVLYITFMNNGNKFDPLERKDKYLEKGEENLAPGGFGITIVKSLSSSIKYERRNHLNCLLITKKVA